MDTKLATTQIRTNEWAGIIRDRSESGLSIDDYCEQHGLSRNAYYYWLRRVKAAALQASGIEFAEIKKPSGIKAVKLTSEPLVSIDVNGMTVHIGGSVPGPYLQEILEAAVHVK